MPHLRAGVVALIVFLAIDAVWLSTVAAGLFKSEMPKLLRDVPNLLATVAFYLIYAVGMSVLVVSPTLHERSGTAAAIRGALLGFCAYATFDLTNLAVVTGWSAVFSIIDMCWGTFATGLACWAGYQAGTFGRASD